MPPNCCRLAQQRGHITMRPRWGWSDRQVGQTWAWSGGAPGRLKAPDGEGVIRIPAEQVATMLYGLGPDTRTDTPGREVLA
ncbi:MAG: hypothetical protein H0W37_12960 [Pseudonocardiales bacterium]|nr:hypothetical protein [Pseudonocardiales bacterium]